MDTDYETVVLPENNNHRHYYHSDTEVVVGVDKKPLNRQRDGGPGSSSGSGGWKSSDDDDNVEITLDVSDDFVSVSSVKSASGADVEDPELTFRAEQLKQRLSFGQSPEQIAPARFRQVTEELSRLTFLSERRDQWWLVEKRFDEMTKETNGLLPRSRFGECIGMSRDSNEFAGKLFDSLSRRGNITGDLINKAQLKEFWDKIADQSFDSRLQIFFDVIDQNADGRITEDEVREIISLSASANKLSKIQKQADEYAALIMEELDPDRLGYIMIENLETLLLQAPTNIVRGESENFSDEPYDSDTEDPEPTWFNEGVRSSFGPSVVRNASTRIRQVSEGCRHLYSASKRHLAGRLDRTSSDAVRAFMGFQFISQDDGMNGRITKEKAKDTKMNLAVPIPLYARERLTRAFRSGTTVIILKVIIYPGNVLVLHMTKPQGFKYKSGQYMLLNCAAISTFEWHPFFITTAPNDDYLSVHIRTLGDWTQKIKNMFAEACQPPLNGQSGLLRADYQEEKHTIPRILIDGPYSSQAQNYEKYEVVLLVGLGIGATPMISILKHIMNNMKAKENEDDDDYDDEEEENGGTLQKNKSRNNFRTRAYFYWVTREQCSFDWFEDVINEAAEMEKKGVIEMHNYCTSVYEEGDARSALISMIQSLNHAKNGVDVVSGTRVKCHFSKPNWRGVYKRIAVNHPGSRIGVFYSGARALVKELKQLALDFSQKTSTKFDFHKERW